MTKSEYMKEYYKNNKDKWTKSYKKRRSVRRKNCKKYYQLNKKKWSGYRKKNNFTNRRTYRVKKYGITLKEYNDLFDKQNGRCLICKKHQSEFKKSLSVDHCHNTNKIRGLLCRGCNLLLGCANEDKRILKYAIKYLNNVS